MPPFYGRGFGRPRPYPYDAVINGLRVMLLYTDADAAKRGAILISEKPSDQSNVVPTDYGEDARSPILGKNSTYATLHFGIGQKIEPRQGGQSGRYRFAVGVDASIAQRIAMPGPDIRRHSTPALPVTAGPLNRFFELGGVLYWVCGRFLVRRTDDSTSAVIYDFGVGQTVTDVAVFGPNSGTQVWAYFAMGDTTPMYRFDGTTVTQHASLTARAFCVRGNDLHRANQVNQVSTVSVDSDPWLFVNWAPENQWYIGDKSSPITRMVAHSSGTSGPGGSTYLVVYKTDGIYSLNDAGEDQQYLSFLKDARLADNGEAGGPFGNDMWVRMGETLWRLDPGMQAHEAGPEMVGTVDPLLQGKITAFAGHGSFHAYAGLYNHVDQASYLLKYGARAEREDGSVEDIPAWHGSISLPFTGVRITELYKSTVGAPTDHTRLYLGFSNGTMGWFVLPCVPDPASCDQYRFSTDEGWIQLSDGHAGFQGNQKLILSATIGGQNLDPLTYARLAYELDYSGTTLDLEGHFDQAPSETISFPDDTLATYAGWRIYLKGTTTTRPPLLTAFSIRWRLRTPLQQIYQLLIAAEDRLLARDGTPLRYGARKIKAHIRDTVDSAKSVLIILPDEEQKRMSLIDISEQQGYDAKYRRWRDAMLVTAVEDESAGVYGTYGRLDTLTYGDLDRMTYGDLESI